MGSSRAQLQQVAAGVGVLKFVDGGERRQRRRLAGFSQVRRYQRCRSQAIVTVQIRADLSKFRFWSVSRRFLSSTPQHRW